MNLPVHIWGIIRLLFKRLPYILLCVGLGLLCAYGFDRYQTDHAPAKEFFDYTQFTVQSVPEGRNVPLTLCRKFKEKYQLGGDLTIQVIKDPDKPTEGSNVFIMQLKGSIREECENKIILADRDPNNPDRPFYRHPPGTYKMILNACVTVKYGYKKCDTQDSNIYEIFADPTFNSKKIQELEAQINALRAQTGQAPLTTAQMLTTGNRGQTGATGATGATGPPGQDGNSSPPPPPQCNGFNLFGICLG